MCTAVYFHTRSQSMKEKEEMSFEGIFTNLFYFIFFYRKITFVLCFLIRTLQEVEKSAFDEPITAILFIV